MHKHCLNAVKMLLTHCPPVKMKMYTEKKVLGWIDSELDDDPHDEILRDAEADEYVKDHEVLLQKKKKVSPSEG